MLILVRFAFKSNWPRFRSCSIFLRHRTVDLTRQGKAAVATVATEIEFAVQLVHHVTFVAVQHAGHAEPVRLNQF